jgi:Putative heavy-metal-binding
MMIATTNELPGYVIDEVYGEVFGLTVRSRNIGSQIGAGLKSILGGELKGMTKALVDSRHQVIGEGCKRRRRHALRHVRAGQDLDGDLRVRHRRASPQGVTAPAASQPVNGGNNFSPENLCFGRPVVTRS